MAFFCGSFMFLFCLVFAMFCARLFICASRSPAGKGLTAWLSFVVSSVSLSLSHWYPGSGVVLDCIDFLIFATLLTYMKSNYGQMSLRNILLVGSKMRFLCSFFFLVFVMPFCASVYL